MMRKDTIAIVWDIENVTPSINSTFVRGLLNYVRSKGRLAVTRVYGDWSRPGLKTTARQLAEESFDLIHLPKKAGDDPGFIIGTQTVELPTIYPRIKKLILITGDAAFTRVLKEVAAYDVETEILCDARYADEELLVAADGYSDFRDLTVVPIEEPVHGEAEPEIGLEESFVLLKEAIFHIENRSKPATVENVRVRLKLMNERFDEANLGFDSWQAYLAEAERRGIVYIRFRDQNLVVSVLRQKGEQEDHRPTIVTEFLKALKAAGKTHTSEGSKAKLLDIGRGLEKAGIDYRNHGYSRLKKVADACAKRGLIHISLKESNYLLNLTKRGEEYLAAGAG
jgi:hypothetical protein